MAPDAAQLLEAIAGVWPADGARVSLNIASESLLQDLLNAQPAANVMIEIPAFMAYGLAVVVLFHTYKFETGATKLLGGILTSFLVAYVLQRFLVRRLARWLVVGRGNGHDKSI